MKPKIFIALLLALTPALASAQPRTTSAHQRPQMIHDRAPKAHIEHSSGHHA